jgi:hypothetical protein
MHNQSASDICGPSSFQFLFRNGLRLLLLALTAGLVFAQGLSGSSSHPGSDPKRPPPLALPEAYALATARLGSATNRFFCVSATCVEPPTFMTTGWTFGFSDTTGQIAQVKVFFDKIVYIDPRITEPLK